MNRKIVHALVAGAVAAATLTGCAAAEPSAGSVPAGESPSPETEPSEDAPSPVAGCTGDLSADVPPVAVSVSFIDGEVEPAPDRIDVPVGSTVVLRAEVDTPAEIHVHGYDVMTDAAPGQPVCLEVLADTPGVFDVEAHPETLLLQLAVQ